jgi:myo-inositol-1(or 4)-monophosphatase
MRQELFTASRGDGAHLNDRRIRVTRVTSLDDAVLGTGFPFRYPQHLQAYLRMFESLFSRCGEMRRAGSAALDLAYVGAGRLDGFWEIGLNEWDIAAGVLLVQEAGGLVGDFSGGHQFVEHGNIVVGNPKVFKAIVQMIRPHLTPQLHR